MSLEYILLGMLEKPGTGYDLKLEFESGAKYFWSAEFGQIYPTLQTLQKRGWLTSKQEPSDKGPPRKVYRRTAQGTREFYQWLRTGPVMGTERFAWIAQMIYLGELNDLDETKRFIEQLRDKQEFLGQVLNSALAELMVSHPSGEASLSDQELHQWMALNFGIRAVAARVDFCQQAVQIIAERQTRASESNRGRTRKENKKL